ncbi:hypothetical protein [Serratia marcescens]|uniref:hypothetical protein n=2 Tax=Serratia TaxID=613 RepID=UPI00128E1068|nr:hypothetical protein [Serratia marcescens]
MMDNKLSKTVRIFVTKTALTAGVQAVMAEVGSDGCSAHYKSSLSWSGIAFVYGNDFWFTEAEAIADCERRRKKQLASLAQKIKTLQAITFTINELSDGQ